jgi:hypothetical protein
MLLKLLGKPASLRKLPWAQLRQRLIMTLTGEVQQVKSNQIKCIVFSPALHSSSSSIVFKVLPLLRKPRYQRQYR